MNLVVVTRDPDQKNNKIRVRGERGRHTRQDASAAAGIGVDVSFPPCPMPATMSPSSPRLPMPTTIVMKTLTKIN